MAHIEQGKSGVGISFDETKLVLLDILNDFNRFCRVNGLRYSIAYGSLIGVVRHHGFIPWDDDIDILIPRRDYMRFLNEYQHPYYKLFSQETDSEWPLNFAKLCDTRTVSVDSFGNTSSIAIDMFILDGLPGPFERAKKFVVKVNRLHSIWSSQLFTRRLDVGRRFGIKKNCLILLSKLAHCFIPYNLFVAEMLKYKQQYDLESSMYCASLTGDCRIYETEKMLDYTYAPFEDTEVMICKNYDYQLKLTHGDYMTLPPEDQRYNHEAIAYWK